MSEVFSNLFVKVVLHLVVGAARHVFRNLLPLVPKGLPEKE